MIQCWNTYSYRDDVRLCVVFCVLGVSVLLNVLGFLCQHVWRSTAGETGSGVDGDSDSELNQCLLTGQKAEKT